VTLLRPGARAAVGRSFRGCAGRQALLGAEVGILQLLRAVASPGTAHGNGRAARGGSWLVIRPARGGRPRRAEVMCSTVVVACVGRAPARLCPAGVRPGPRAASPSARPLIPQFRAGAPIFRPPRAESTSLVPSSAASGSRAATSAAASATWCPSTIRPVFPGVGAAVLRAPSSSRAEHSGSVAPARAAPRSVAFSNPGIATFRVPRHVGSREGRTHRTPGEGSSRRVCASAVRSIAGGPGTSRPGRGGGGRWIVAARSRRGGPGGSPGTRRPT
jgi:hypothetical protein